MMGCVFRSDVCKAILLSLDESPSTRSDLVDSTGRSRSSVYESLKNLEEDGLVIQGGSRKWRLTSKGVVTVDLLRSNQNIDSVMSAEPDYWETHDVSIIPARFRYRLGELGEYEVVRGTQDDPFRIVRRITDEVESAKHLDITNPIYHDRYLQSFEESLKDSDEEFRLITKSEVLDKASTVLEKYDNLGVRTFDVNLGLISS
ncbi:MAG: ArsR family transcriptional regulator, partial [Halobacteria archaeon]|nr:ArsR family transcriptional regulator [Halobacteria archaeon]